MVKILREEKFIHDAKNYLLNSKRYKNDFLPVV